LLDRSLDGNHLIWFEVDAAFLFSHSLHQWNGVQNLYQRPLRKCLCVVDFDVLLPKRVRSWKHKQSSKAFEKQDDHNCNNLKYEIIFLPSNTKLATNDGSSDFKARLIMANMNIAILRTMKTKLNFNIN
jgi:hypothetical protein